MVIGYLARGSTAGLVDIASIGILLGTWIRGIGIVTALVADVMVTVANYRVTPQPTDRQTM